ncbi:uncharacterized protein EKO05_0004258 [Ascochyta rabiei]|uniref:uncharacterized protein n=1 Tax=Didymella rabiei TaxID=5454 RepID=UPI0021FF7670|nr:uncharacterized protein EKO05_0004258 [Ascochyta rabiei]UPX13759.1 hypothetical protein EKO05_0004258 [Ascochyta rabiei]
MLVVVVSQIISQRKWEWFGTIRERPVSDLQKFDSGSRGIVGAIQLLPTVLWRDLITSMAAIILFTSFLVGPSVQLASRTSECTFAASGLNASISFAHYIPRRSGYVSDVERDDLGVPAPDLITVILSAVTAPGSVENRIRGSCSTGNCTFPNGDPAHSEPGIPYDKDSVTHSTVAMCNKCTDISSLVVRENSTCGYPVLSLPNNMSVSRGCGGREVVRIQPNSDLSWMGELLTSELRTFSRWAYVNASFVGLNSYANETVAAVMCSLYPCVQTYTTSISNNEVSETKVGSKVMQLDMLWNDQVKEDGSQNTLENLFISYTAVQSPCRAQGQVYDLNNETSAWINGTDLALHDFTDYGHTGAAQPVSMNITAPKECIYRQHPQFVVAISRLLNHEIFNGSCRLTKTFNCRDAEQSDSDEKFLPGLGAETVLRALYGESYTSLSNLTTGLSNVTEWFDLFAEAMTRRFRSDYGSADEGDRKGEDLPLDEIHGLAWQMTTCVSMRGVWLIFPISLTVITAALAIWTMAKNWRHRKSRPVWKDSTLPLIFYGRDIVDGALDKHSFDSCERASQDQSPNQTKDKINPLETRNMEKIGDSTAVTIPWLHDKDNSGEAPTFRKRAKWSWHLRKNRKKTSDDQLLDKDGGTEIHPEIHTDQAIPDVTEPHEDNQTLEVEQIDGDTQSPGVTESQEHIPSCEEAEPRQSSPIHPQAYTHDRVRISDDAGAL